jgi:hypothetical protein
MPAGPLPARRLAQSWPRHRREAGVTPQVATIFAHAWVWGVVIACGTWFLISILKD